MNELKPCPVCNGQGFVGKWELWGTAPRLHKCECQRCGGVGCVMIKKPEKRR